MGDIRAVIAVGVIADILPEIKEGYKDRRLASHP